MEQKKKIPRLKILAITAILLLMMCALTSCGGKSTASIYEKLNVREDILSAIDASKKLSGENFYISSDGGFYYSTGNKNYAYAYYGKEVKGIFADASSDPFILAIMEDGSLYNGLTLLSEGTNIIDVAWKTHNTNIDAYVLGSDGQLYYYNPYSGDDHKENSFEKVAAGYYITAICRAQSYAIFFGLNGEVYQPNIFMSGGSTSIYDADVSGWSDIVVAACAYKESSKAYTTAGISANGTVYAAGDYADDILAMGDLVYITMYDDASLIVGLTTEGTLKFAGSSAAEYEGISLSGIVGVKAFEDTLSAVDEYGNIYVIKNADEITILSETGINGSYRGYYMNANGDVLSNTDGLWVETENINAATSDNASLLYYLELSKGKFNSGRGMKSQSIELDTNCLIMTFDIDQDGQNELLLSNGTPTYLMCIYNGTLSTSATILYNKEIYYYPNTQCICFVSAEYDCDVYEYGSFINGTYTPLAAHYKFLDENAHDTYSYFGEDDLPYTDSEGDALREESKYGLSETEFKKLIKSLTNGQEMQKIEGNYLSYEKANLSSMFLGETE